MGLAQQQVIDDITEENNELKQENARLKAKIVALEDEIYYMSKHMQLY